MKAGDLVEGEITELTLEGSGFLRHSDGRSVFVSGTWPGDVGVFRITRVAKRYAIAALKKLHHPSAERREQSPCPHFGLGAGECGGCLWMIADYAAQLRAKEKLVRDSLARISVEVPPGFSIWADATGFAYRNRAQLKTDGKRLGYVSRASQELAEIEQCMVLNAPMRTLLDAARASLPRRDWRPRGREPWQTLHLDDRMAPDAITTGRRLPFRQGNSAQNERMRAWVASRSAHWSGAALELFAGDGNLTESLPIHGELAVLAIESNEAALATLAARLPQVSTRVMDIYRPGAMLRLAQLCAAPDFLLLDPPRDGCGGIGELLSASASIREVIYVSCQLHSFCRDAAELTAHGFHLADLQAVDQFPQTPHIELLAHFVRSAV